MSETGSKKLSNPKHERFSQEMMVDNIGGKAAARAGYSEKTADAIASRLLRIVKVSARVDYLRSQLADKIGVKAEDLVRQLNILRQAKVNDYVELITEIIIVGEDDEGEPIKKGVQRLIFKDFEELTEEQLQCIDSIKDGKYGIELKLHGIEWSIEKLSKYVGLYEVDNKQKTIIQPLFPDLD